MQEKARDVIHINDFGGVADSSGADNAAALNNAAAEAVSSGVMQIDMDGALYYFATQPAAFTSGITLVGRGKRKTHLVRNYTAQSVTEAFLDWTGSVTAADGGGLRNCIPYAATGTTSGAAIKLTAASASSRPGHMSFLGGEVSGVGTWAYAIYADGSGVTTAGAQGIRDITFMDFGLFNCTTKTILVKNAVNWHFVALSTFTGSGNAPDITVDGGGASDSNSQGVYFSGLNHGGAITVQNCNETFFSAARAASLTIDSTATNGSYVGYLAAAPTNGSTSWHVLYTKSGIGVAISGAITAISLAGTGSRTVVADANGLLSAP